MTNHELAALSDRDLGRALRNAEDQAIAAAQAGDMVGTRRAQRLMVLAFSEAVSRGYVMDGSFTQVGAELLYDGLPVTVSEVHEDGGITVDHGRERVRGVPGSRYTRVLTTSLVTGAVRKLA